MTDLIPWLISAEIVGLAAFPLVFRAFPGLSDRGFGLAIPAGLLIVSSIVWALSYIRILPNDLWAWWLVVVLVAAGGVFAVRRQVPELRRLFRERWPALVAAQVVFLVFFLSFAMLRAHNPDITNTEKPMEILMLNAAVTAEHAPPPDPWLAGETVAYYYGGYWNLGGVATLSSVPPSNGFNLSLALIAAMAASAMFSLVYSMVARDKGGIRAATLSGVASTVLLLLVASLAGWWELMAHLGFGSAGFYEWLAIDGLRPSTGAENWRPEQFWWWFRASRVINTFDESGVSQDFTIQEFPAFSFVLGDLHPHVISIPFVIVGLAAAFNLFVSGDKWGWSWIRRNPYSTVGIGLIVATSGFTNQADILLMTALFSGTVALKAYSENRQNFLKSALRAALPLAVVAGIGVLLFSPFYFGTLGGQLQSPPVAPTEFGTRPVHFLTVWGVFLVILAPFAAHFAGPTAKRYAGAMWRQRSGTSQGSFFNSITSKGLRERLSELRYAEDDVRPGSKPETATSTASATSGEAEAEVEKHDPEALSLQRRRDTELLKGLDSLTWIIPLLLAAVPYLVWAIIIWMIKAEVIDHSASYEFAQVSDIFTRLPTLLPLGVIFVALAFVAMKKSRDDSRSPATFALLIAALSVYMLYGAELFFVHDLFGNRMNTVFKFYFQVWIMFSAVAGYAAFYWAKTHRILSGVPVGLSRTAAIAVAVLLVGPLWYTVAAGYSKANDYTGPVTLDGWAFLDRFSQADAAAIDWLNDEAEPGSHIVEAVGGGYTEHGRISAATGLPAVIGWVGHQRQWRGTDELFAGREQDVRDIYELTGEENTRVLLERYDVKYVVVGPRERATYPGIQVQKFDSLGDRVFEGNGVAIYDVRGQTS